MSKPNKTKRDAQIWVLDARMGYLAGASDDFLLALQGHLHGWADEIKGEMAKRIARAEARAEAAADDEAVNLGEDCPHGQPVGGCISCCSF